MRQAGATRLLFLGIGALIVEKYPPSSRKKQISQNFQIYSTFFSCFGIDFFARLVYNAKNLIFEESLC